MPQDVQQLSEPAPLPDASRLNLVGESRAFRRSLKLIGRIAGCDATVLVQGETGTGKELAARAIHYLGQRADAPFIPINCGAIPETLVESELFGHARGAFTDARAARRGLVAQAEGGTLFLDEIEAMGERAQIALLRFLQDREYRPVGGAAACGADVRVIAASNVDLEKLATGGPFRQDLLFRLNVLTLELPPLRDRDDDVVLLAQVFLRRFCRQYRKPARALAPEAIDALRAHTWPGNVRELENLIHREVLLEDEPSLTLATLAVATDTPHDAAMSLTGKRFRDAKAHAIASFERAYITELMARTGGNISLAARLCGKERSRLGKLVKKYGLERSLFGDPPRPA